MAAEAGVSSEGSAGGGSASELTQVVIGWIQFLVGCWTEAVSLLLSVGWRPPQVLATLASP